jgi:hypothetical protein
MGSEIWYELDVAHPSVAAFNSIMINSGTESKLSQTNLKYTSSVVQYLNYLDFHFVTFHGLQSS